MNRTPDHGQLPAVKRLHYNPPQIRGAVVRARREVLLAARRFGKTTGVIAERCSWNAFRLHRSLGGIVMPSHKKFLTSFISSFVDGLEDLGYVEERDFFVGCRGPRHWEQPFHKPKKYDHAIHWRSGSAEAFISQFAGAAGAGQTLDRLIVDEAKYIDGDQFAEETLPAMSGHPAIFRDMPEHRSMLLASDRPYNAKGRWFYKYKDQMDPLVIRSIIELQLEIDHYRRNMGSGNLSPATISAYRSKVSAMEQARDILRAKATYWHEASSIDNIHALGVEYIANMAATLDVNQFMVSILNMDVSFVEGGFYPDLDDELHGYHPVASAYTASLGLDREARRKLSTPDCRHDAELIPRLPLEIAMDYGNLFNCIVIGQTFGDTIRIDNALHVYHPAKVRDVLQSFIAYYTHHPCKDVIYYYDHTAVSHDGKGEYAYHEIVLEELRKAGWNVRPVYIGMQPEHNYRYELWGRILGPMEGRPFNVRFNLDNCENLLMSMHTTAAKQDAKGFRKDKAMERNLSFNQAHAPHYSDACDTLIIGHAQTMEQDGLVPMVSGFA